ncbi:MAG: ABC transporter permease subunit [Actinobacteria bacterium]|nr:ABC transporter permease subunit [Actinomycetota bacterium]
MDLLLDVVVWFGDRANWRGDNGLLHLTVEHVVVSAAALALAMALALPVGLVLGHLGRGGVVAVNAANVGRAVPSFAVLVIALQLSSIGVTPTVVALVALAVPPMVTNSWVGVRHVDDDVREAARGMGMTGVQLFRTVELPLALPVVMAGVRTAAVQVVATAALAAVVGYGGLGALILLGLRTGDNVEIVAGSATVAALALITEIGLGLVQRGLTAEPLRRGAASAAPDELAVAGPG